MRDVDQTASLCERTQCSDQHLMRKLLENARESRVGSVSLTEIESQGNLHGCVIPQPAVGPHRKRSKEDGVDGMLCELEYPRTFYTDLNGLRLLAEWR